MKKVLLAALLFSAVSFSASAQEKEKSKNKNNFENLNLTAAQKTSIDSIRTVYKAQRDEVKNSSASAEEKGAKMKEINHSQMAAINSVLTDDQRKQLKAANKMKEKTKEG